MGVAPPARVIFGQFQSDLRAGELRRNDADSQVGSPAPLVLRRWRSEQLAWLLVVLVALAAAGISALHFGQREPAMRPVRLTIGPPENALFSPMLDGPPVVSPDGGLLSSQRAQLVRASFGSGHWIPRPHRHCPVLKTLRGLFGRPIANRWPFTPTRN
jgi:hypothetical protein